MISASAKKLPDKKIIVIMPAYNAEKTLRQTFRAIPKGSFDSILLVDDGSSDHTSVLAKSLGIETIIHATNKGYGANQKTCYQAALKRRADIIVMLHPDYQYDPAILPSLTVPIAYGYADIVLGSRILGDPHIGGALQGGMPMVKYMANRLLTAFQNYLLHMHLSEYHTGYRAYSRQTLKSIPFMSFSNDFIFDNEILVAAIKQHRRFKEVPVSTKYFKDASSINLRRSIKYGTLVILNTLKARKEGVNFKK